ncbi:MAG TPA: malto-oligosyltrehalose synthase [Stellaceae bacterium]|jgi:(1->4)-alpha-D-glucan 1-alpha-D-glucosylmutase
MVPRATYRLQFNRDFTLRDALRLIPYLAGLGVSHVYASPLTEARPGSTHGYDIVDHNRLNPEIGSDEDFAALVAALHERGMGLIVDIVPNHMGVGGHDNAWWLDVLEWGQASPYAAYFDINWEAARPDLRGRVLLPVLGDQYGVVLESGEIKLRFDPDEGSFSCWYYEHRFPISPASYPAILGAGGDILAPLAQAFAGRNGSAARGRVAAAKEQLRDAAKTPEIAAAIDQAARFFAGEPGRPFTFRRLHRLLDTQFYRVAYWRVAADEINYRRFFNINDLAGLRMEIPALFAATHRLILDWARRGDIDGIRIDHIDGLFDPRGYLDALRKALPEGFYIVAEKIMARYEPLPDWPIDGTTGYDFVNQVLGLFVDPDGETAMTRLYQRLTGRMEDFDTILYAAKERIMRVNLSSEMNVLARRFHRLSMRRWHTRDFTRNGMLAALEEVVAAFPVYRTYLDVHGAGEADRRYVDWAFAQAKKRWLVNDTTIFDFLHEVLTGAATQRGARQAAMQFQQVTGPVMAKAAEDTAFYRYFRLIALNEVGGDPRRFGISVAGFHHLMRERAQNWPQAMLSTATHDTKRGEDARIRLALISEMPRRWGQCVTRWLRFNRSRRSEIDGRGVPGRNIEYLFYQALLGAWPGGLDPTDTGAVKDLADRLSAYMTKAVREGKEESGWSNPNDEYEAAVARFVTATLDATRPNAFLKDFAEFVASLAPLAAVSSLAQLALKLTVPGVPDIYRGCEFWDFSLVDPDNRRPVDWAARAEMLRRLDDAGPGECRKLYLTQRLLGLRAKHPALFSKGDYVPLTVEGGRADDHVCAFTREHDGAAIAVVVPRLVGRLYHGGETSDWGDTSVALPNGGDWEDVLGGDRHAGGRVRAAELFSAFPVAVLLRR